jgi:hypothetical protein
LLYSARLTPDVAYAANSGTSTNPIGFAVLDGTPLQNHTGWIDVGGTSTGAPQWSAIVASADQQRGSSLDTNQVQATLYNTLGTSTYAKIFHDITIGSNGFSAGPGYDLATGLGTPIASALVPLLAGTTIPAGLPTVRGSGTAGSPSFISFGSFAAKAPGGGLFSSSGSVTITGSGGEVSVHSGGPAGTPSLSAALAAPRTTPPASASTTVINFFAFFNTTVQGSPSAQASISSTLAVSTNVAAAPSNTVFGASGWNGSPLSWRLSSLGFSTQAIDQLAADLSEGFPEKGNDSFSEDSISTDGYASGMDLFILEGAPVLLREGQVNDGGDAGGGE